MGTAETGLGTDPALLAMLLVMDERAAQDKKWGVQNHDFFVWSGILAEEVGETAHEALCARFGPGEELVERSYKYVNELRQATAVALAMLECALRNFKDTTGEDFSAGKFERIASHREHRRKDEAGGEGNKGVSGLSELPVRGEEA